MLLGLAAFVAWGYYTKSGGALPTLFENSKSAPAVMNPQNYQCDGRQHCSQMGSYDVGERFMLHSRHNEVDGDNDGIPCERQFGR